MIKLVECNGKPVAKLSLQPGKATPATIRPSSAPCARLSTCRRLKRQAKKLGPTAFCYRAKSISLLRQTGI
ncbi:hypothetical protein ACLEB0_01900 [Klebsiella pneumoniae]